MKIVVVCLLLIFQFNYAEAQEVLQFEIMHNSKSLGTLKATKVPDGDKEVYTITSDITKSVLTIRTLAFDMYVEFKEGQLVKSDYKLHVNGKLKKSSNLLWQNNSYSRVINGKQETSINEPILFSSSKLLFEHPNGVDKTFSESKLVHRPLFYKNNKVMIGKSSSNTDTEYSYINNVLQEIFIDDFVDFKMVPINN